MTLLLSGASSSLTNENHRIVRLFGTAAWVVAAGSSGPFTTASVIPAGRADENAAVPGVARAEPVVLFRSTNHRKTVRDVNGQTVRTKEVRVLEAAGTEMSVDTLLVVEHGYSQRGAQNYGSGKDIYKKQTDVKR